MRREIDRQLLVHPNCLMFFCDDTGHEDFRDRSFPDLRDRRLWNYGGRNRAGPQTTAGDEG